jgi:ABC-type phosphate transport system substrate-binding protein
MRWTRTWRLAAALVGVATLGFAAPAASQANFTAPYNTQCSGTRAVGVGTELQSPMANVWVKQFGGGDTESPLSCAAQEVEVGYDILPNLRVLEEFGSVSGVRNQRLRFGATEEPPTASQWLNIDLGSKPFTNSGLIRQIPVAMAAVVPLVNFPAECTIPAKEATSDGRFIVSNAKLEKVFAGEIATWGELLPGMEGSCASTPIKRVVPEGPEGATYVFKQWLNTVDPSAGWPESTTLPNASWPNDSGATATVRSTEGDYGEAKLVSRTSGSIGFSSLSWARFFEFGYFSPENPEHNPSIKMFWLSLENGSRQRVEPTRDPKSGADNVRGANCDNPQFNITPSGYDTTATPIWRAVSAAGSKTGWPICTLMYDLAWDDAAPVYGNTSEVEGEQRTVKDYLAYVLGEAGQQEAEKADFSALPAAVLADAKDGQSRVGWNKFPGSKEEEEKGVSKEISAASTHH